MGADLNQARRIGGRVYALDALRGVAALTVVVHHYIQAMPDAWTAKSHHVASVGFWLNFSPLRLLWGGWPAVLLFFVLSGFALGTSLNGERQSYSAFMVRRVFRLFPACLVVLAFAAVAALALHPFDAPAHIGTGSWFAGRVWTERLTWVSALHYGMLDGQERALDGVIWSLIHELRFSLAFPAILYLVRRWPAPSLIASVAISAAAECFVPSNDGVSWADTGSYLFLFVIGCALAVHGRTIIARLAAAPRLKAALWGAALFGLMFPQTLKQASLGAIGLSAALALALILSDAGLQKAFGSRPLQWLGKVSFSLYLVHVPILAAIVYGLRLPILASEALALPVALLASEALFRYVEAPAIQLARRLTQPAPTQEALRVPA